MNSNNKRRLEQCVKSTKKIKPKTDININDQEMDNVFNNIIINMIDFDDIPTVSLVCKKWRASVIENVQPCDTDAILDYFDNADRFPKTLEWIIKFKKIRETIDFNICKRAINPDIKYVVYGSACDDGEEDKERDDDEYEEDGEYEEEEDEKSQNEVKIQEVKLRAMLKSGLVDPNCICCGVEGDIPCWMRQVMQCGSKENMISCIGLLKEPPTESVYAHFLSRFLLIFLDNPDHTNRILEMFDLIKGPNKFQHIYDPHAILNSSLLHERTEVVRLVLESNVIDKDKYQSSKRVCKLKEACEIGNLDIVELLLKHGFRAPDNSKCINSYIIGGNSDVPKLLDLFKTYGSDFFILF
jgi:hypothetical protein